MTNETIIDKNSDLHEVDFSYRRILEFMDLARADERAKLKKQICMNCLERIFAENQNESK